MQQPNKLPDPQVQLLSQLLRMEKRLRTAESIEEKRFIAVNETLALVNYDQAVLGNASRGVLLLSGVTEPDLNAPYVHWCKQLLKYCHKHSKAQPVYLTAADLPETMQAHWQEWLPTNLAVLPLASGNSVSKQMPFLLLARSRPFVEGEKQMLQQWSEMLAYHLANNLSGTTGPVASVRQGLVRVLKPGWLLLLFVLSSFFIPVKLTVLAPAEVVAADPVLLRSPIEGVIEEVLVEPNQFVQPGDLLFRFDDRSLRNQLNVTEREILTAQAAYRQAAQQSLFDASSKNQLAYLQSEIETAEIERDYLQQLLLRTEVESPIAGQVLLDSKLDWVGRPVSLGERLVLVADPKLVKIEAWLSPNDQVPLVMGSPVTLFESARPDSEREGFLSALGYQLVARPDGSFAFKVRADFKDTTETLVIGSQGTLRLEGETVSLAYMLTRRPIALLRQWLGA